MIARIQQLIALTLLAASLVWLLYAWPDFHHISLGFLAIAGVYAGFVAIEFAVIHRLNRSDDQPRATWRALLRTSPRLSAHPTSNPSSQEKAQQATKA